MTSETAPRASARERIVDIALVLFGEHGVNGTSLQMIADALGVTKAAVYHQFRTKDAIVLAVVEEPLQELAALVERATAERSRRAQLGVLLEGFVDLVVANRPLLATFQVDPGMVEVLEDHPASTRVIDDLERLVIGDRPSDESKVVGVLFLTGVSVAAAQPRLADLDEVTLRHHLREAGRRLLSLPAPRRPGLRRRAATP